MNQEILFDNLEYGAYIIEHQGGSFTENYKYDVAGFNKLYTSKVRLPDGKGNVIYLLSDIFDNSIRMLANNNFIIPSSYTKVYYPWAYSGSFMGRFFRFSNSKERNERVEFIRSNSKFREYPSKTLTASPENVLFSTADMYEAIRPILEKTTMTKCYEKFYPEFIKMILSRTPVPKEDRGPTWNNRIIIIDCDAFRFKMGAPLSENRTNPLYLLYLAYMRIRDLSTIAADMDMLICSKNLFLKFNPSKLNSQVWPVFKRGLFRIMNANMDDYMDQLSDDDKSEIGDSGKMKLLSNIVQDQIEPYTKMISTDTAEVLTDRIEGELKKRAQKISNFDKAIKQTREAIGKNIGVKPDIFQNALPDDQHKSIINTNPAVTPLTKRQETLFASISGYEPLGTLNGLTVDDDDDWEEYPEDEDVIDEFEDDIRDDVTELLTDDEEIASDVMDDIQERIAPSSNPRLSPVNSARDEKLREEQKKIVVKNSTIEEILEMDADNVPIESSDKSAVMHTSNKNMYNIKFANFNKTYLDHLYTKDLIACFDCLKDKSSPFYVTGVEIKDTSTNLDYKETWTVHLKDENNKRHTINVDIPKFKDDRFMFFRGTKWIILNQNFYNPLVKDTPDTVIITTNYNKVTVSRKATKSLGTVERIYTLIKKAGDQNMFTTGNSSVTNMKYVSTLEYDEISRSLFKFKSDNCELYFSRKYIDENLSEEIPSNIKGNEFYIGHEGNTPILIDEDTGLDRSGRTIADIIEMNLPDDYKAIYNTAKAPSVSMYAEATMANEDIPVIVILLQWIGLTNTLKMMKIFWKFHQDAKRLQTTSSRKYIRFADGILEYEAKTFAELILNGINKLHPNKLKFSDFDTEIAYDEYIYTLWGSYKGISEIRNFYEFLIDPITKSGCKTLNLPDDAPGLLICAVKLLADNAYVSKASDKSYRTRTIEMISGILYECIAKQYKAYVNSGHKMPMTLNRRCVINQLIKEKTVEAYSTLNPVIEVSKTHTISTKGFKGSNSEHSYDEEKRSYDPSAVGKLAISTSPDANVGVNKSLVVEPTLLNARGYRANVDESELKDVNIFSPTEMLTPGTARGDDPIRTAICDFPVVAVKLYKLTGNS